MICLTPEQIDSLARGTVVPHDADALRQHVEQCAMCRQKFSAATSASATRETPAGEELTFPTPPPDSFPGYQIIKELHRGGQGVVYQAIQKSTKRKVALKVMREGPFASRAERVRFEREVEILGQLNHPDIVAIHDSGEAAGHFYYVMDYISGQPLDAWTANPKRPIADTLRLLQKICEAVNAAHLRGVIHRDLKPGNIRIDAGGEPHILDFGLAKVAHGAEEASLVTMTGQFMGSLPWASPEQAAAVPGQIDVRTDVYSLGVILYQMLTGKFPYDVLGSLRDVLDRIMRTEPTRPSTIRKQIDDEIETIVLKCLSKERERRYQSAGELARDVGHYLRGEPIEAKRDSALYVLRKHLRRYRVPAAIAAAFVLVVTAGLVASLTYWSQAVVERDAARKARDAEAEALLAANEQRALAETQRARAEREADNARNQAAIAKAVNDFLNNDLLALADPYEQPDPDLRLRDALKRAEGRLQGRFADQPLVEAAIRETLGNTFGDLGEYPVAAAQYERAGDLYRAALGDAHPSTLRAAFFLGLAQHALLRFDEAEVSYRRALDGLERVLGETHKDTLDTRYNLARLNLDRGRCDAAETLCTRNIELAERSLGAAAPLTLHCLSDLGRIYHCQGRYREAEAAFLRVIEREDSALGETNPLTVESRDCLANLYLVMGRCDEAEQQSRKVVELRTRILGADHPYTLGSLGSLARILQFCLNRPKDAEPLYREMVATRKRTQPWNQDQIGHNLVDLGISLLMQKRYEEAEPVLRECLSIRTERSPDWYGTAETESLLGEALLSQNKFQEAEDWLVKGHTRLAANLETPPTANRLALERLVKLYTAWGKPESAQPWQEKLNSAASASQPATSP